MGSKKAPKARIKSTVKWFDPKKGFGFIHSPEGGADIFAHHSEIVMEGFRTLKDGQQVEFELAPNGDKGVKAVKILTVE